MSMAGRISNAYSRWCSDEAGGFGVEGCGRAVLGVNAASVKHNKGALTLLCYYMSIIKSVALNGQYLLQIF